MGVTIKQIAEMAGVHRSTVDKVLHHREGVSDSVRLRIQKIIDECNYQANPIGKALKMQDKEIQIGIILLQVDALPYIKEGIEKELKQYRSFQIKLECHEIAYSDVDGQARILHSYRNQKKDGIIIMPLNAEEILYEINCCDQEGIPVVTVNTDIKHSLRLCFIGQDGYKAGKIAGRLMGEFINSTGKLAIFTSDIDVWQSFAFENRETGFRKVINESFPKISILPSIITGESHLIMYREVKKLLEEQTDIKGIFITCGGVKEAGEAIKESGGKNIKLICYENYPEILKLLKEEIVTVTLDSKIVEQGIQSVNVLLEYLIYDTKPYRRHYYSDTVVMVKESLL